MDKRKWLYLTGIVIFMGTLSFTLTLVLVGEKPAITSNGEEVVRTISKADEQDLLTYEGVKYKQNEDLELILFMGVDKREEVVLQEQSGNGGQSDCILVLAMDNGTNTTKILEISRDSMTDIRINNVQGEQVSTEKAQIALQYAYGDGKTKSCWLMKNTVENFLKGTHISGYLSLNIDGIATINDAMGGVTLTVPEDYTTIEPLFKKGTTLTLNGEKAERYVRYRDIEVLGSNEGRIQRQNQYMVAFLDQLKEAKEKDRSVLQRLYDEASPYMVTDMNVEHIQKFGNYEIQAEEIVKVPGEVVAGEFHDEFHVDEEGLMKILVNMFYKPVQ